MITARERAALSTHGHQFGSRDRERPQPQRRVRPVVDTRPVVRHEFHGYGRVEGIAVTIRAYGYGQSILEARADAGRRVQGTGVRLAGWAPTREAADAARARLRPTVTRAAILEAFNT